MEEEMLILNKGYKYQIYPTLDQRKILDHHIFISNQAYNVCLNSQQDNWEINKDLDPKDRTYINSVQLDNQVKLALKNRELPYSTVITQQARINAQKALKKALKDYPKFKKELEEKIKNNIKISKKDLEKGFPKFKNSKKPNGSFNWNNQGFQIKEFNSKFKILRLLKQDIKIKFHRALPEGAKIKAITISREDKKYFVSFNIEFNKMVFPISKENLDIKKAIGIDLNIRDIALSNKTLIKTHSKSLAKKKYSNLLKMLQRKQSRRIVKSKKEDTKFPKNFKKTQAKINKIFKKISNKKNDLYHKITSDIVDEFDMIVVEDLKVKNMTKSAKGTKEKPGKNIKQKSGLNKSILDTSFYQIISMLEYKAKHNGKLFTKVLPQYTSKTCSKCGQINPYLTLKQRQYTCECGNNMHRDINASINILNRGLSLFGLGTSLVDSKQQSLSNSETLVSVS